MHQIDKGAALDVTSRNPGVGVGSPLHQGLRGTWAQRGPSGRPVKLLVLISKWYSSGGVILDVYPSNDMSLESVIPPP